jgi:hypothetical protein
LEKVEDCKYLKEFKSLNANLGFFKNCSDRYMKMEKVEDCKYLKEFKSLNDNLGFFKNCSDRYMKMARFFDFFSNIKLFWKILRKFHRKMTVNYTYR